MDAIRPAVNGAACGSRTCADQAIIAMPTTIVRLEFSDQHHDAFVLMKAVWHVFFEKKQGCTDVQLYTGMDN